MYFVHTPSGIPMQMDYRFATSLNLIPTQTKYGVYGHNPTPTVGVDVWEGGTAYPFQLTAVQLEVLSASTNDGINGTGARTVKITGLDSNYNQISEIITLNGTSIVQSVNKYFRVNAFDDITAGSGQTNAGDITLRVTGAGATQAIMRAGYGYAKSCIFTVPAGYSYVITDFVCQVAGTGNNVNITYGIAKIENGVLFINNEFNATPSSAIDRKPVLGNLIPEKATITMRITAVGGIPSGAFASVAGILINNSSLL